MLLLQLVSQQCFVHANCAVGSMIVLKARMQALVSEALVTMAITWKLGQRLRNLLSDFVSLTGLSNKLRRFQGRSES